MSWPAEERLVIIATYRGKQEEDVHDDNRCVIPSNRTLPGTLTNNKNGYAKYIKVPSYNVVSPGNACMLASIQMLMRLSQPHLPTLPAMYIQRACNEGKGLHSYRAGLEIIMEFASRSEVWPLNENYEWMQDVKHFRIVTGEKAAYVFDELTRYEFENRGAFCFYAGQHAFCASSSYFLTQSGADDDEHIYCFNVSNIGSTTSQKKRAWFYAQFAKDPSFEILYMDDIEPELSLSGDYLWNEGLQLFEPT